MQSAQRADLESGPATSVELALPAANDSRFSAEHALGLAIVGAAALATWTIWRLSGADFVIDDTYITFRYARHLARGDGLVWNVGGDPTQGYTNQLLVWLLAGGYRLGFDPLGLAHGLNALGLGSILVSVHHLSLPFTPRAASPAARLGWRLLAPISVLLLPVLMPNALTGLETLLTAGLLFSAASALLHYFDTRRVGALVIFSLLAFACMLSRPDSAVVVALWFALLLLRTNAENRAPVVACLGVFVATGFAYLGWLTSTFGHPLPNSFFIKVGRPLALPGLDYLGIFVRHHAVWLAVIAAGLVLLRDRTRFAQRLAPHAATLALPVFYVFTDPLMGAHQRFLLAAACFLVAAAALCAMVVATQAGTRRVGLGLLILVLGLGIARSGATLRWAYRSEAHDVMAQTVLLRAGRALARIPHIESALIALGPAGAVPFATDAQVIDLVGLNDNQIARHAKQRGAGWVIDYALEQRPDLIFFLSYPDGRIFDKGHGVIGSAYSQLHADPRFAQHYVHASAMDVGWGHAHWFVRDDSRFREPMQRTLGELSDFESYSLRD